MGRKLHDLSGARFGRLVVAEYLGRQGHSSLWRCVCDCGGEAQAQGGSLKSGSIQSCGCYRRERMGGLTLKHGDRGGVNRGNTPGEYKTWEAMRSRCQNPNDKSFRWYGGRGICVFPAWDSDYERFIADVGRRPSAQHSLDRYPDKNGNYEPGNVRWATDLEQARNRRNNSPVPVAGKMVARSEAAEMAGLAPATLTKRLASGWTLEDALSKPLQRNKSSKHRT